jgi:hypothetical protein
MSAHTSRDGFILVLTLLITSLAIILVTQFATRSSLHLYFDNTMIEREQAKNLAMNGLQIAMAQLHLDKEDKDAKPDAKKGENVKDQKKAPHIDFLERVLPILNRLQTFKLTKDIDGVDGTIQILISSEDGKINIDQLYDYDKKTFFEIKKGQEVTKKIFSLIFASLKRQDGPDLFEPFQKYMKDREYPLDDITDLLESPAINAQFKDAVFFEGTPPAQKERGSRQVFLTDLFTAWSDEPTVQPWLLSPSVKNLLGIKESAKAPTKAELSTLLKDAKVQESSIKSLWDTYLKKLYGKEFSTLPPEAEPFLSTKFEPTTFSVLSYGSVNQVTQKVLGILKRTNSYTTKNDEFELIRIYWL